MYEYVNPAAPSIVKQGAILYMSTWTIAVHLHAVCSGQGKYGPKAGSHSFQRHFLPQYKPAMSATAPDNTIALNKASCPWRGIFSRLSARSLLLASSPIA